MEQTKEALVPPQAAASAAKRTVKRSAAVLCVTLASLAALYLILCACAASMTVFYPNRDILGVKVGGLTAVEAQAKLERILPSQQIFLTDPETREVLLSLSASEAGFPAECFQNFAQCRMDQQQQTPFLQKGISLLSTLFGRASKLALWPSPDPTQLHDATDRASQTLSLPPVHGTYALENGHLRVTRSMDGRALSEAALESALTKLPAYSEAGIQITAVFDPVPAKPISAQQVHDAVSGEGKNAGYDAASGAITPEVPAVTFDVAAAQAVLDAALPGETVELAADIRLPAVTAEKLKTVLFRDVLGECRTHVTGTAARVSNVRLSAKAIHGTVLNSGDIFSYNAVVGQRTAARGYQAAPAYVNGETVDEIGGGICQTSSTLYLACLRSDLEITERYAHRYIPSYIDRGMDATVSWNGPDYRFTNNTDYPIKIETEYADGYLTVRLLGTNETGGTVKMTYETVSSIPWTTIYKEDTTLSPGTERVQTTPYTGYLVRTYRNLYDAWGNLLSTSFEATSNYKSRNKVVLRGPSVTPEPELPVISTEPIPVIPPAPAEPQIPTEANPAAAQPPTVTVWGEILLPVPEEPSCVS